MDRYERAEALLDLIESDFGQSDRFVRLEAIRCEFEAMAKRIAELEEEIARLRYPDTEVR